MARTITNYATLDYRSGTATETAVSNLAQTTIRETLQLTKDVYDNSYRQGDTLTYILQIISRDDNPTSLTVTDDLGTYTEGGVVYTPLTYRSYLLYVGQTLNPDVGGVSVDVTVERNGVRFVFDNLPSPFPGLTLIIQSQVNEYAPLYREDNSITNTASLFAGGTEISRDSAVIMGDDFANVRILKSITPDPVTAGAPLTYTFVICNYGTLSPTDVTLRDLFAPALQIPLLVTVDGNAVDSFDYDGTTGMFVLGSAANDPYVLQIPSATFLRDEETGAVTVEPGQVIVSVSGVIRG